MKHRFLISSIFALCAVAHTNAQAPRIFGSNMVIQRDKPVPVWGKAAAGQKVTVSFAGQSKSATADAAGAWMVTLDAMPASAQPRDMEIQHKAKVVYKNVLVGEVWVCSGQSNMEWSVDRCANPKEEAKQADYPAIRHIKVPRVATDFRQADINSSWTICSPSTAAKYTAVGYYFGRALHQELKVPIGLINTSWGGTRIEPWTPLEGFKKIQDASFSKPIIKRIEEADPTTTAGKIRYAAIAKEIRSWATQSEKRIANGQYPSNPPAMPNLGNSHQSAARLYRGMIHPLVPFAMRGAIWYQGESNGTEGVSYYRKMQGLIGGWRQVWGQGDFPFYFVQLANFTQDRKTPEGGDGYAKVRDAQRQSLQIPNTGMAVIIDIGEARDIHPKNKQDVGKRLAAWALARDYGKAVLPSGPLYKSHKVQGKQVRVRFDYVGEGLIVGTKRGLEPTITDAKNTRLERFAIAGEDRKWHWAEARIDGDSVVVSSPEVPNPVAVRYAYSANPVGANLYNSAGLPASPFRTDNW